MDFERVVANTSQKFRDTLQGPYVTLVPGNDDVPSMLTSFETFKLRNEAQSKESFRKLCTRYVR